MLKAEVTIDTVRRDFDFLDVVDLFLTSNIRILFPTPFPSSPIRAEMHWLFYSFHDLPKLLEKQSISLSQTE